MRGEDVDRWSERLAQAGEVARSEDRVAALRRIVDGLRPSSEHTAAEQVAALIRSLRTADPRVREQIHQLLRGAVGGARILPALTRSGAAGSEGFLSGLTDRLLQKLLPSVADPADLRDLVRVVFHRRGDHLWVESIPDEAWRELLDVLGIDAQSTSGTDEELTTAIRMLSHDAASLGLQPEVTRRLPHLEREGSPFFALPRRVTAYLESFENDLVGDEEPLLDAALATVERCRHEVRRLRTEKHETGTSLSLTALSHRLLEVLDRLDLLLHLTEPVERDFQGSTVRLFKEVVRAEKTRDHVIPHLRSSADLLALEIVEHAARKGSKYITRGRTDYLLFLLSSMGGGLLVAFFATGKVLMGPWEIPLGLRALLYGLNYSLCFVLIYLTGATLATKQPAMTANTLARSLGETGRNVERLEDLIVRVWRSQFISFVGNLVVALPVAVLLAWSFLTASNSGIVSPSRAADMLEDLHPWRSPSLIYAAVAGLLLFAAGLVSGWVDNWLRHRGVPERIAAHPALAGLLGPSRARGVAAAVDRTLGALAGNVFLGFGLGSMGTLGVILGLPLDIRHIAFASAEFGLALQALDFQVPAALTAQVGVSVALIGLVNFLVSFGLSLMVAIEARGLGYRGARRLATHLQRHLLRRPLDWFVPPGPGRAPREAGPRTERE